MISATRFPKAGVYVLRAMNLKADSRDSRTMRSGPFIDLFLKEKIMNHEAKYLGSL